jgi:uncharacterized secreted protein with C-terminal beta-propeller domain
MARKAALGVLALVLASTAAASAGSAAKAPGSAGLVPFRSCGDLLGYVKGQTARFVGPYGIGSGTGAAPAPAPVAVAQPATGAAPQPGVDYSGTNDQEQGVDEPDIVKTDGSTLYAVMNGRLNAVDVSGPKPRLLDSLPLASGANQQLLLVGDKLLVLARSGYWITPLPAMAAQVLPIRPTDSTITEVDVSDPSHLQVVSTLALDGGYVDARLVGSSARVVVSSQIPAGLKLEQPADSTQAARTKALADNRATVAASRARSWLPTYSIHRAGKPVSAARPLVQCRSVDRPKQFSGLGMLTVLTIDVAKGLQPVDSVGVMTDARIVYASPNNLYLATEQWSARPLPATPTVDPPNVTTQIHRFDISDPDKTHYRGSGTVNGYLLDQWSLSENDGVLRVVSTNAPAWWETGSDTSSSVTTLALDPGALTQVGQVGGLGAGERVYAVRFVGDTGYVVTFKQIDPLYTVDLSDPVHPKVLGELDLPGFSAYLHPVGADMLLGVGQYVEGSVDGTQISLFDVGNPARPAQLARTTLGSGYSEAEADHHAFLFWPPTGLLVIPFNQQAVGYRVSRSGGIDALGTITQSGPIERSLVAGASVFTVSSGGVESSSLAGLQPQGFAAFPPGVVQSPPPGAPVPVPAPAP